MSLKPDDKAALATLGLPLESHFCWDSYRVIGKQPEGSYFGEHTCLLGHKRLATVVAVGFCEVHSLERLDLEKIAHQWPELAQDIMSLLEGCVLQRHASDVKFQNNQKNLIRRMYLLPTASCGALERWH